MGVGLNSMLALMGTIGVAGSKVSTSVDQKVGRDKAAAKEKEAKDEKAKNDAVDEAKMNFQLDDLQRDKDTLSKDIEQNFFEQGLARSEGKMDNLQALQKARMSLMNESEANDIRQNQIRTIMQLKGYGKGGKK